MSDHSSSEIHHDVSEPKIKPITVWVVAATVFVVCAFLFAWFLYQAAFSAEQGKKENPAGKSVGPIDWSRPRLLDAQTGAVRLPYEKALTRALSAYGR